MLGTSKCASIVLDQLKRKVMNSENEVAVLQQILPAHDQRHEPFLHTSESDSSLGVSKTADTDQAFSSPSAKVIRSAAAVRTLLLPAV